MYNLINQRLSVTRFTTLIKAGLFGVIYAEILYLSQIIALRIDSLVIGSKATALVLLGIGLIIVFAYLSFRGFYPYVTRVVKSGRWDILAAVTFGVIGNFLFGGIGTESYFKIIDSLNLWQLFILLFIPIAIGLFLIIRTLQIGLSTKATKIPFFISDAEQKSFTDDLLGFAQRADRFSERVLNNGSPNSMIFGIDAPWGIGKSTFINFCKEYWEKNHNNQVIIYNFNPIKYEGGANLLEKFIDGLVRTIQKHYFIPELRPLISKYSRFIRSTGGSFSFFGFNFDIFPGTYTIDDALEDLENMLSGLDKKIIVVVDDLDRLNFSSIKSVLFAIKKGFTLTNISYVLCYDSENISALEKGIDDPEKIMEFLEKFVNVKISLFLDSQTLSSYVSENLARALNGNSQADPILVSKAVAGLSDIYKSPEYHEYLPFIGDIRKLKRLVNTLVLLEIEKTDFDNSDFDKKDLIHLLLLYINYPNVFRKIYNTETRGKRGFFSVTIPYDDDYPESSDKKDLNEKGSYRNSSKYSEYIKSLHENPRFLLDKVFNVSQRLENAHIDSVPQEIKNLYACFNGEGGWTGGRNLEQYLNLIVNLSKPQKEDQHRFYLNCMNEIIQGKSIADVLSQEIFMYTRSEGNHEKFWRIITNSPREFNPQVGAQLIKYLLNNIQNYSLFTDKEIGVGLRDDLDFFLIALLDAIGWSDENGKYRNNTEDNISEIAEWVFGKGRRLESGVLEMLSEENRGVLGLYDLLAFRLFCSADRGGDNFNLQRALGKHGSPNAPTQGPTRDIAIEEMREISQKVFEIFKKQYIDKKENIFELVDMLSLKDLTGKYQSFVEQKITSGEIKDANRKVESLKSRIKSFTTYQLGNSLISSGVGCGYYDPAGNADKKGIRDEINDYLFNICFNPTISPKNYEHFVDYLLINFASVFATESGRNYIPHINEFIKVLDRNKLAEYWKNNSAAIRALNLSVKEKLVIQGNYDASYKDDLPKVYEELDNLVVEIGKHNVPKELNELHPLRQSSESSSSASRESSTTVL